MFSVASNVVQPGHDNVGPSQLMGKHRNNLNWKTNPLCGKHPALCNHELPESEKKREKTLLMGKGFKGYPETEGQHLSGVLSVKHWILFREMGTLGTTCPEAIGHLY